MISVFASSDRTGLLSYLVDFLNAWWNADRIRVEPSVGRLMALRAGDRILLHRQLWTVTARDIKCRDASAMVRYSLRSDEEELEANLFVSVQAPDGSRRAHATMRRENEVTAVWDTDVVVLEHAENF